MRPTLTKPCRCGARQYREELNIEFCPDCAPNKSLAVYREEQRRAQNPELPFTATQPAETPESLRARAAQIRNGAEYADDPRARRAELDQADRLEQRAREMEVAA